MVMRAPACFSGVQGTVQHADDHFGVFFFFAGLGAVFAIAGESKVPFFLTCSSRALVISFSEPAKCSQLGMMGEGLFAFKGLRRDA